MFKKISMVSLLLLNPMLSSLNDCVMCSCVASVEENDDAPIVENDVKDEMDVSSVYHEGLESVDYASTGLTLPVVEYDVISKQKTFYSISYSNSGYSTTASKAIMGPNGYYSFKNYEYNSVYNGVKDNLYQTEYKYRPYSYISSVGQTYVEYGDNGFLGSCFTVGNNIILSAAHCFYKDGKFPTDAGSYFVLNENKAFAKYSKIKKIIIPKAFYDGKNIGDDTSQRAYDWCVCVLKDNVGDQVGYLSVSSGYTMAGCYNYACGYPSIDGDTRDKELCYSAALGTNSQDSTSGTALFNLYNYLLPGMSGGPVMFYYENSMTFEQYFGVSSINTMSNKINHHGYSVKITNAMIETLRKAKTL